MSDLPRCHLTCVYPNKAELIATDFYWTAEKNVWTTPFWLPTVFFAYFSNNLGTVFIRNKKRLNMYENNCFAEHLWYLFSIIELIKMKLVIKPQVKNAQKLHRCPKKQPSCQCIESAAMCNGRSGQGDGLLARVPDWPDRCVPRAVHYIHSSPVFDRFSPLRRLNKYLYRSFDRYRSLLSGRPCPGTASDRLWTMATNELLRRNDKDFAAGESIKAMKMK